MVKAASPVAEWNRMSARTFPEDALRPGDIITRVNAISIDTSLPKGMETEPLLWALKENCELLIIVRRPVFQRCQL